ncbi:hypothetical protein B0J13DRAFT_536913 [Dactylonectria estremocensis]|uniref:MARVEL domain-containing protein n=1 Tax=Dactylonectria estremocensis TaxID=1079267 RepID=A0A9P9FJS4_9HYPO|nr:hypothetical protein B0J13DRAFT_536913 [Dactylonectria estremocensis]
MSQPLQPEQQQQQQQQRISQYQQYQPQPYQQQQQQQFQTRPPPPHISSKGMYATKLVLRILSMISAVVLIGISASVAVSWDYGPLVILVPPAGVAFIWDVAESICLCTRRGHRGIHPGAVVGVDLILWLGYIVAVVLFGIIWGVNDDYYYSYYYSSVTNYRALIGFGAVEIILHLTLFIIGCYETNVRNRNPSTQVIYVQAGANNTVMYPSTYPMAQAQPYHSAYYTQAQVPSQQYQYTPLEQPKMTELSTAVPAPVATTYNQPGHQ